MHTKMPRHFYMAAFLTGCLLLGPNLYANDCTTQRIAIDTKAIGLVLGRILQKRHKLKGTHFDIDSGKIVAKFETEGSDASEFDVFMDVSKDDRLSITLSVPNNLALSTECIAGVCNSDSEEAIAANADIFGSRVELSGSIELSRNQTIALLKAAHGLTAHFVRNNTDRFKNLTQELVATIDNLKDAESNDDGIRLVPDYETTLGQVQQATHYLNAIQVAVAYEGPVRGGTSSLQEVYKTLFDDLDKSTDEVLDLMEAADGQGFKNFILLPADSSGNFYIAPRQGLDQAAFDSFKWSSAVDSAGFSNQHHWPVKFRNNPDREFDKEPLINFERFAEINATLPPELSLVASPDGGYASIDSAYLGNDQVNTQINVRHISLGAAAQMIKDSATLAHALDIETPRLMYEFIFLKNRRGESLGLYMGDSSVSSLKIDLEHEGPFFSTIPNSEDYITVQSRLGELYIVVDFGHNMSETFKVSEFADRPRGELQRHIDASIRSQRTLAGRLLSRATRRVRAFLGRSEDRSVLGFRETERSARTRSGQ